jgi:hypothetical protein
LWTKVTEFSYRVNPRYNGLIASFYSRMCNMSIHKVFLEEQSIRTEPCNSIDITFFQFVVVRN